jgi:hypothetical protein
LNWCIGSILKKCEYILSRRGEEENEFIRKDAKIHFGKNKIKI